eukprot:CAMPEP_0172460732 /NCGR_PEP_ID=MMETSP1065-20121228/38039_1 /TAXON_ID=265537 /ORGANISM="Amphiprora paludosa, Strain CCMP125" /LENGTH=559 /DNA_ID=CAMNT_0013215853 /DNA_START=9 /DNA_END=1688 /DNA_ORIENTATION=+
MANEKGTGTSSMMIPWFRRRQSSSDKTGRKKRSSQTIPETAAASENEIMKPSLPWPYNEEADSTQLNPDETTASSSSSLSSTTEDGNRSHAYLSKPPIPNTKKPTRAPQKYIETDNELSEIMSKLRKSESLNKKSSSRSRRTPSPASMSISPSMASKKVIYSNAVPKKSKKGAGAWEKRMAQRKQSLSPRPPPDTSSALYKASSYWAHNGFLNAEENKRDQIEVGVHVDRISRVDDDKDASHSSGSIGEDKDMIWADTLLGLDQDNDSVSLDSMSLESGDDWWENGYDDMEDDDKFFYSAVEVKAQSKPIVQSQSWAGQCANPKENKRIPSWRRRRDRHAKVNGAQKTHSSRGKRLTTSKVKKRTEEEIGMKKSHSWRKAPPGKKEREEEVILTKASSWRRSLSSLSRKAETEEPVPLKKSRSGRSRSSASKHKDRREGLKRTPSWHSVRSTRSGKSQEDQIRTKKERSKTNKRGEQNIKHLDEGALCGPFCGAAELLVVGRDGDDLLEEVKDDDIEEMGPTSKFLGYELCTGGVGDDDDAGFCHGCGGLSQTDDADLL